MKKELLFLLIMILSIPLISTGDFDSILKNQLHSVGDDISDKEINFYMKMERVEDILNYDASNGFDVNIKKYEKALFTDTAIKYTSADNWDKDIQKVSDEHMKMGAMVFVYGSESRNVNISKRSAIVFKKLSEMYGTQINFLACLNEQKLLSSHNIKDYPSFALYARGDITEGDNLNLNYDLKIVDILKGGPVSNNYVTNWSKDIPTWWIDPLVLGKSTPDNTFYKFKNTGDYIAVKYE
jgi:hypothetical protein